MAHGLTAMPTLTNTPRPATRADLDALRCATPGCECGGILYLAPVCHPRAACTVRYFAGVIEVLWRDLSTPGRRDRRREERDAMTIKTIAVVAGIVLLLVAGYLSSSARDRILIAAIALLSFALLG